jgi:hypothetical protein
VNDGSGGFVRPDRLFQKIAELQNRYFHQHPCPWPSIRHFRAYVQEVLQGARDEREYKELREYLDSQTVYSLPEERKTYEKAARLFFDLRRKGITVRGAFDVLIALTAMEYDLMLLHDDRDFDAIASKTDLAILDKF